MSCSISKLSHKYKTKAALSTFFHQNEDFLTMWCQNLSVHLIEKERDTKSEREHQE